VLYSCLVRNTEHVQESEVIPVHLDGGILCEKRSYGIAGHEVTNGLMQQATMYMRALYLFVKTFRRFDISWNVLTSPANYLRQDSVRRTASVIQKTMKEIQRPRFVLTTHRTWK
jgi:hypothetical protein